MIETQFTQNRLSQIPILGTLSATDLAQLEAASSWVDLPADAHLFSTGETCETVPVVVHGSLRVTRGTRDGLRSILLYRVRAGDLCAHAALSALSDSPAAANAACESDSCLLLIPAALLKALARGTPEFARLIHQRIAWRQLQIMELIETVAFSRLEQRLATRLLGDRGPLRTTHQKLARDLGSAREVVSRLLKEFEQREWIRLARGSVMITNPQALESLAGPMSA